MRRSRPPSLVARAAARAAATLCFALALALLIAARDSGAAASSPPKSSALARMAQEVASGLGGPARGALVYTAALRTDESALRGPELTAKIAALLAASVAGAAQVGPVSFAAAQALAQNASAFVYVAPAISAGQLEVTAEVYRSAANAWDRAKTPALSPLSHVFARADIDAEIRSYLAPVPLLTTAHIDRVTLDERDVLAVACGRSSRDGELEILTLSRRALTAGRARAGRFAARRSVRLKELAPVAGAPLREPIAGAVILAEAGARPTHIDVAVSDRAHGSRLDVNLGEVLPITGIPEATSTGDACRRYRGTTLESTLTPCAPGDAASPAATSLPTDAAFELAYATSEGEVRTIAAARDPRTARLDVTSGGVTASLPGSGAQVVIADLDQDGEPEILSSLDVAPEALARASAEDALVVSSWRGPGTLVPRARVAVPTGVRALAACPPGGGGASWIVLATPSELWIVR